MADLLRILTFVKITVFGISICLALLYALSLLLIRELFKQINILTLNICFGTILISTYFMVYFIMHEFYIEYLFTLSTCTYLFYIQSVCLCQCSFSFVTLTVNRFFTIVRHAQRFFKTKIFMFTCIAIQWIVASLVSLPFTLSILPVTN